MATKAIQNAVNTATDNISTGTKAILRELQEIYNHINSLYGLNAGQTADGDEAYDVRMNTVGVDPYLQYWDGAAWQTLGASGLFSGGLAIDTAAKMYSRGAILERADTDTLELAGDDAPVTIAVDGKMLQITSSAQVNFTGQDPGKFALYVKRIGTTSEFDLHLANFATYVEGTDERIVGSCYWNGANFEWVKSLEMEGQILAPAEDHFWMYTIAGVGNHQAIASQLDTQALPINTGHITLVHPERIWPDDVSAAAGVFTAPKRGLYEFHATAQLTAAAATTIFQVELVIVEGDPVPSDLAGENFALRRVTLGRGTVDAYVGGCIKLQAGDKVRVKIMQNSGASINMGANNRSRCAFWGKFLGDK